MNDEQAIGIFDSGVGGLTVLQELQRLLPHESLIYFGDTARMPYGEKSRSTIIRYAIDNAIFLMEQNIKLLVIACNTASAFAKEKLQKIFKIPLVDVIAPGAEKAVQVTQNGRIAVLGTKGTISSGIYQAEIKKLKPDSCVFSVACPLLAPLVEERFVNHQAARLIVMEYMAPFKYKGIDTVLLGCTHYPLLKSLIQEVWGSEVTLVDSASTCAEKVSVLLQQQRLTSHSSCSVEPRFFVSDDPAKFKAIGEEFLGSPIHHVVQASSSLAH
jgi:glutamate racemase